MLFVTIKDNLQSLIDLLQQLSNDQYNKTCTVLTGASIGQHYRHIIEVFAGLLYGYDKGFVNYDHRPRNQRIETDLDTAHQKLEWLLDEVQKPDKSILIEQALDGEKLTIKSNYYRELLYNLDHMIHHQALIKIGVAEYDNIVLSGDFGVAPSTMDYRKQNT